MFLLIGVVVKNAILLIDFYFDGKRAGKSAYQAVDDTFTELRFRPILMTNTLAALLGAVPLALSWGEGAELRQPLVVVIVSGLNAWTITHVIHHACVVFGFEKCAEFFRRSKKCACN